MVTITSIQIQFQGGFSCKQVDLKNMEKTNKPEKFSFLYPEDINNMQMFVLEKSIFVSTLHILLNKPTDMFGRIIIYNLNFFGNT